MQSIRSNGDAVPRFAEHPLCEERAFLLDVLRMLSLIESEYTTEELARISLIIRRFRPLDSLVCQLTDGYIRKLVPDYHWGMLHDVQRNDAYKTAIQNCITPNSIVLDVGCGAGLLSIMAARAGAGHVYACESNGALAAVAEQNIERAGFSSRVSVINKRAEELRLGADLPSKCNVLLHELFAGNLVGEGVLRILDSINAELLTDDAVHLPNRFCVRIQGVRDPALIKAHRVSTVDDIDLSALNVLAPSVSRQVSIKHGVMIGRAQTAVEYSIVANRVSGNCGKRIRIPQLWRRGIVGFIQWISFTFPDGTTYENIPGTASHWKWRFYPIEHNTSTEFRFVVGEVIGDRLLLYLE